MEELFNIYKEIINPNDDRIIRKIKTNPLSSQKIKESKHKYYMKNREKFIGLAKKTYLDKKNNGKNI